MADPRPRNRRPRTRGGANRLARRAAAARQDAHIAAVQTALQPAVDAVTADGAPPDADAVAQIRAEATRLAAARLDGDVTGVVDAVLDELWGLGPLEPALRDPDVRTIAIDGADLHADGEPLRGFRDPVHARAVVDRILAAVGADLSASPGGVRVTMGDGSTVDARLVDGRLRVRIARP